MIYMLPLIMVGSFFLIADLLIKETNGELGVAGLVLILAEDQLISAEEFINVYKKLAEDILCIF